jgi:hypothetical protein
MSIISNKTHEILCTRNINLILQSQICIYLFIRVWVVLLLSLIFDSTFEVDKIDFFEQIKNSRVFYFLSQNDKVILTEHPIIQRYNF